MIAETAGGGATGPTGTVREYIWLPETEIAPTFGSRTTVDRPMAVVSGVNATPALYFVHVDHLHRPIKMTDASKAAVWTATYWPFGAAQTIAGPASLNLRFPGQWFQLEAGLHYNWHRHYDPTLGRYTQPDPLGFVDGPSVYAYGRGSPQLRVDPSGRFVWTWPAVVFVFENVVVPAVTRALVVAGATALLTGDTQQALKEKGGSGIPPSSGGPQCPEDDDDDPCEEQDRADRACCMSQIIRRYRGICHEQASLRTSNCRVGRPIPPLGWCGR